MKKSLLYSAILMLLGLSFTKCTPEENEDLPVHNSQIIHNAVTDVDGNQYNAVVLGEQVWMKSNLRTTHFRDGSPILNGGTDTFSLELPCYFQSTATPSISNGLHYNWAAVNDPRALCPEGWHVPTDEEWAEMEKYVSSQQQYVYGYESVNIAKALASQEGWKKYPEVGIPGHHPEANNATNLSIVPAGYYAWEYNPTNYGYEAIFWSATEGPDVLYSQYPGSQRDYFASVHKMYGTKPRMITTGSLKYCGFSVRCVRD